MNEPKNFNWTGADIKVKDLTTSKILEIYFFKIVSPLITHLTRFSPFSLFWQDRRFHYKHKKITDADDLIIKIAGEKNFWFKLLSYNEDDNFLNIFGKFEPLKKNSSRDELFRCLKEKMVNKDVYINALEDGTVKISLMQKR